MIRRRLVILIICLLTAHISFSQNNVIWAEAEQFDDLGGWTVDWQFIDQMGSPFLLSIGYGEPVASAKTVIDVPRDGEYQLWVRTRDWVPGHKDGAFAIHIDGKKSEKAFGKNNDSTWSWEKGGTYYLKGKTKLEIEDLSGYYGRCDAVVLCNDKKWIPPTDVKSLNQLRIKYGAISSEVDVVGDYDVVIVGGGLSGCMAAVSAARKGAKTVLIQNRGELGGNASTENLVPPVGSRDVLMRKDEKKYDPRETGLIEEIALPLGGQRYAHTNKNWPFVLRRLIESEPNLDLYLNTHATGVTMKDKHTIGSVETVEAPFGQRRSFKGKIFIDCTGNGTIGISAGANYMYGREGKNDFDEKGAPEKRETGVMPSSLKYWYEPTGDTVKFTAPSWITPYISCKTYIEPEKHLKFRTVDTQWIIELGGKDSIYVKAEKIRDDLLKLVYGIFDHQKNHCDMLADTAYKYRLAWVGHVIGMRESYRLKGDYVMSEKDVTTQPLLEDRIAFGGWGLDDHPSLGFINDERVNREVTHTVPGVFYSVPYRSLYSDNVSNLMFGGRNISVTHRALSAVRVMYTLAVIGQASGTAAGMCATGNYSPRDLYKNHITELQQQLMKDGAFLIELPNKDPNDIALRASKINSSSNQSQASNIINGYARAKVSVLSAGGGETRTNAWCPDIMSMDKHWVELNWNTPQSFNVIHLSFLTSGLSAREIEIEYNDNGKWRQVSNIDNSLPARRFIVPIGNITTDKLRINLNKVPEYGGLSEVRVYNETANVVEQIKRANYTMSLPEAPINYPWKNKK